MAAELVETNRLYAHNVARIRPEWIEKAAGHLVKRSYGEPQWNRHRGSAQALERVTLYGLPIVSGRQVDYGRIDPEHSRELFIRHALVEGDWDAPHKFVEANRRQIEEIAALEDRCRRRDLLVENEALVAFFEARLPPTVLSSRHFDRWWKTVQQVRPDLLTFEPEDLLDPEAGPVDVHGFPDTWPVGGQHLQLTYVYDSSADDDGVTVHIPVTALDLLPGGLDWHVPGLRPELVASLLRTLPKDLRRGFVPVPDHAADFLRHASPPEGPLLDVLPRVLGKLTGLTVPARELHPEHLAPYLQVRWQVEDERGGIIAAGRDLEAVKGLVRRTMRAAITRAGHPIERDGQKEWTFGEIPRTAKFEWAGQEVAGYPALVDQGNSVAVRVLASAVDQERAMWAGTRRLLLLNVPFPRKHLGNRLTRRTKLALGHAPHAGPADLLDDCVAAAVDRLLAAGGPAWNEADWKALLARVRDELSDEVFGVVALVGRILEATAAVEERAERMSAPQLLPAVNDVTSQLSRLVYPDFVAETGAARLPDVLRYVRAAEHRLERLPENPGRDRQQLRQVQTLEEELGLLRSRPETDRIRWLIEELRVSLFAQSLGTNQKVSAQRIHREIAAAR